MCWLDFVRESGVECPNGLECYHFMLSIVDYKKRTPDDGIDFLISRCPVLDIVVIGMAKQGKMATKNIESEEVIKTYLNNLRKDFHERLKKVEIPKEFEPITKEIAQQISELDKNGIVDNSSFESLNEDLLKKLKKRRESTSS
jgi:uncharacterized protein YllA (UPF0747 family)